MQRSLGRISVKYVQGQDSSEPVPILYDGHRSHFSLYLINTHYYFSSLIPWVGSRQVGAPGTTGSHKKKSSVIWLFLAHPQDVIRPIGSSYLSNDVFIIYLQKITRTRLERLNKIHAIAQIYIKK